MRNGYTQFIHNNKVTVPGHVDDCDCVMIVQLFM